MNGLHWCGREVSVVLLRFCLRRVTFETPKVTKRVSPWRPRSRLRLAAASVARAPPGLRRVEFGVALARNGYRLRRRGRLMRATYRRGAASRGAVDQCIGARGKRSPNPLGHLMGGEPRATLVPKAL
jgi:hypothetical protein